MTPDEAPHDSMHTEGRRSAGGDPVKRQQILDGARQVFMSIGFDGASMGDIARAASVSKGTLYVYFDSKEALFVALVADERRQAKRDFRLHHDDPDVEGTLRTYGQSYIAFLSRPRNIESLRTVMAIAQRFPSVGEEFYRDGPKRGLEMLTAYLDAHVRVGRLSIGDTTVAARQLVALFQAGVLNELLFGVRGTPSETDAARTADEAVATFLARYGVAGKPEKSG